MLSGLTQSVVLINKMDPTHQVVFKRIGRYTTDVCKGRDVLRTDLNKPSIRAYYLEDLTSIKKCKFDLIEAQEYVFQIAANQWIIS
jgi:hypothetical protein